MKKVISLIAAACLLSACSNPVTNDDAKATASPLPTHPDVVQGQLDNGMQYVVLPNAHPANRISLKLVVKAGSLHEQDDQKGIAHLVEHMAFNGTALYPANSIIERQRAMGMVFGRDVNATTTYDTTSYYMHLPSDADSDLDEAVQMLAQQASALSFVQEELEKERPVVEEEWRRTLNMRSRLSNARQAITLKGSRYQQRAPIGDMQLVRHVDASRIKAFWDDWYHPNNMLLVAVGAVSEQQIRALTEKYFATLPSKPLPTAPSRKLPLANKLIFAAVSDAELSTESVSVTLRAESQQITTVEGYRQKLIAQLATYVASDSLRNQYQAGGEQLSHLSISSGAFFPGYASTSLFAIFKQANYQAGLQELFSTISRQAAHGFSMHEIAPVRDVMIQRLQNGLASIDKTENSQLLHKLAAKVSQQLPFTDPEQMAKLGIQLLGEIGGQEVNQYLRQSLSTRTPVIVAQVRPESRAKLPDTQRVAQLWQQALDNPPAALKGIRVDGPLFTEQLPDVEIVEHQQLNDVHVWTLANNTQIWFQPSDHSQDTLLLSWQGDSGTQALPPQLRRAAQLATRSMHRFGYAGFDPLQLEVLNAGKSINIGASVAQNQHLLAGSSNNDSYEAWLQNLYLQITQPQVDTAIWQSRKQLMTNGLRGAARSAEQQFAKQIDAQLYANNPVLQSLTEQELAGISADDLLQAWKQLYGSADGHRLIIVGNAAPEWIINTAATYIGNLPRGKAKATSALPALNSDEQVIKLQMGSEPKANSQFYWLSKADYSESLRRQLGVVSQILNIKLMQQLREQAAGVYSSRFSISADRYRQQLIGSLSYSHQPERTQELKQAALAVIAKLIEQGISEADLAQVRSQVKHSLSPENIRDSQRMTCLARSAKAKRYQVMPDDYLSWLDNLSTAQLNSLVRTYLSSQPTLEAVLLPEATEG